MGIQLRSIIEPFLVSSAFPFGESLNLSRKHLNGYRIHTHYHEIIVSGRKDAQKTKEKDVHNYKLIL